MGETVFIGLGSNVGDRVDYCDRAVTLLGLLPHSQVTAVSSLYETEPITDERSDPGGQWFLNGVVRLETDVTPSSVLAVCREIERAMGRDPDHRGGPRTMDLDLLFYGDRVLQDGKLTVPHPRLHLRRFVLAPLVDIDPGWRHPVLKQTMQELLEGLADTSQVRRLEPRPGSRYGSRPTCSNQDPAR